MVTRTTPSRSTRRTDQQEHWRWLATDLPRRRPVLCPQGVLPELGRSRLCCATRQRRPSYSIGVVDHIQRKCLPGQLLPPPRNRLSARDRCRSAYGTTTPSNGWRSRPAASITALTASWAEPPVVRICFARTATTRGAAKDVPLQTAHPAKSSTLSPA